MKTKWKIIGIIILVLFGVVFLSNCFSDNSVHDSINTNNISINGTYDSKEDVSAYILKYHKLPNNYVTKSQAKDLGWKGGSLDKYAPGLCIGGDTFSNRQGSLPSGHDYVECDIDTLGEQSRGSERIIYSTDTFDIYYTSNHYKSFTKLN